MFLWYKGREFFRIFGSRKQIFNYLFKKQLSMKIILNFSKCIMILSLLSLTCTVLSCDEMDIDQGTPISSTRNLMISFKIDTITYGQIPAEHARRILSLDESTSVVTDKSKRSFRVNELFQIRKASDQLLSITSYSAKTVYNLTLEAYVEGGSQYIPIAYLDSIPGFSQFEFKPERETNEISFTQ